MVPHATVFLQFHHCDAFAVIKGEPQRNQEERCEEFERTLKALGHPMPTPAKVDVTERFRHKVLRSKSPNSPRVSVLVACYRYLKRFRIFARSLMEQDFDLRQVEVVVANPHCPDGLSEFVAELRSGRPTFREVLVDPVYSANRGFLIQKAFEGSSGDIVIGMDCDLVLPTNFVSTIARTVTANPHSIVGAYRNFLSEATTIDILDGRTDPVASFTDLMKEDGEEAQGYRGVLGYCQALRRDKWEQAGGYPTEFNTVNQSDVTFVDRLATIGVSPLFLRDLVLLHLNHVRDWRGTKVSL